LLGRAVNEVKESVVGLSGVNPLPLRKGQMTVGRKGRGALFGNFGCQDDAEDLIGKTSTGAVRSIVSVHGIILLDQ
jgi:hypothetical protein